MKTIRAVKLTIYSNVLASVNRHLLKKLWEEPAFINLSVLMIKCEIQSKYIV